MYQNLNQNMLLYVSLYITKDTANTISEVAKFMIMGSVRTRNYFNQMEKKGTGTQSFSLDTLRRMGDSLNLEEQKKEPEKSKLLQKVVITEYYKKLFEEFFIVGPDDEEIKRFGVKEIRYVRPKKLYQYPNNLPTSVQ